MTVDAISQSLLSRTDTDLVTHEIRINEAKISAAYQVVSMTIQEGVHKIPLAQLVIRDGSASEETFEISDKGDFSPGNKIEILLGYHGHNETVFKGIIITNSHKINSHCCEMNIECKDERAKMTVTNNGRHYEEKTDDEIIDDLISHNNMPAATRKQDDESETGKNEEGIQHEFLVQSNISDWDFMVSRVDVNKKICLIHNGDMTIKKPDLSEAPSLFLTHGIDILELQLDMDSRTQASTVEISSWDYKEQKIVKTEGEYPEGIDANRNPQEGDSNDPETKETIKDLIGKIASIFDKPQKMTGAYMTAQEMQAIADSKLLRQTLSPAKGRVKYQGLAKAVTGGFINISGVANQLNGKHFVSAIQHDYTDGCWTTEATLGWDDKFFTENINPHHPSSTTGQASAMQGLHIGIVTNIEDQTGQYRVKVRLPLVNENEEGVYARVATLDAGDKRGTFFRPETGDEVLVGFMNDDPRHPVILGMLHSSKKQAPLEPEKPNNKKGYISRSGIKMLFDDEKKSIIIETPGSRIVELDDEAGSITIKDDNGNKIVMDASGISIEAAKDLALKAGKSISLSAPEISMKADATMTVEGSGTTTVKSGGITEIKGSMVKIN